MLVIGDSLSSWRPQEVFGRSVRKDEGKDYREMRGKFIE